MTHIDQFESVFKAADKAVFEQEVVNPQRLLVVTDLDQAGAERFMQQVQTVLEPLDQGGLHWDLVRGDEFDSVGDLLQRVGEARCDMVCLYRNLHTPAREYPYSLGVYVDVLTQASSLPVLLMPHPAHLDDVQPNAKSNTVMAITDHLTGDHHLVSFAARCVPTGGRLLLTHVEDEAAFERFMAVISRVPSIDTEDARETVHDRLLKEPGDYIDSVTDVLRKSCPHLTVEKLVTIGHHLTDYRRLIEDRTVDLVVLNTKDDGQLAMHGLAYSLAVELRETPMLLL